MSNWRKWILPGIIVVALLTAASVLLRTDAIEKDLTAKSLETLKDTHPWASVELEGRDLVLLGTAPSQAAVENARKRANEAYDIRIINDGTQLLAEAKPYRFSVTRENGQLVLSGNAPSELSRRDLVKTARETFADHEVVDRLELGRGAPRSYEKMTEFAFKQLEDMETGVLSYTDQELEISGIAAGVREYASIQRQLERRLPDNVKVSVNNLQPATVSPYQIEGTYTGSRMALEGFVPTEQDKDEIEQVFREKLPDARLRSRLQIANGAPDNWNTTLSYLADILPRLSEGKFSLEDKQLTMEGSANSLENYREITGALSSLPGGYELASGNIRSVSVSPYVWSATRSDSGIQLSGFVPDDDLRAKLLEQVQGIGNGLEIKDGMEIGDGAGESYQAATAYGAGLLQYVSRGKVELSDGELTLEGEAASAEAFETITAALKNAPVGISVTGNVTEPVPPLADPYLWRVVKNDDGVTVSGNAPDQDTAAAAVSMVNSVLGVTEISDQQVLASGEPDKFMEARRFVTDLVASLDVGEGKITGTQILLSGRAGSEEVRDSLADALNNNIPDGYAGSMDVSFPEPEPQPEVEPQPQSGQPPAAQPESEVEEESQTQVEPSPENETQSTQQAESETREPFRWRISKTDRGVVVSGNAVSEEDARAVIDTVGKMLGTTSVKDEQAIASGNPEGLDVIREKLAELVSRLEGGQANIVGNVVSVIGRAPSDDVKAEIENELAQNLPDGFEGTSNVFVSESTAEASDTTEVNEQAAPAEETVQSSQTNEPPAPVKKEEKVACQREIVTAIDGRKIFFDTNRATLKPASSEVLAAVAKAAANCPNVRIEIAGHTDSRGEEEFNQQLSQARANSVREFLSNSGVAGARLEAVGYGESQPVADNIASDGRARNRRIEFIVID